MKLTTARVSLCTLALGVVVFLTSGRRVEGFDASERAEGAMQGRIWTGPDGKPLPFHTDDEVLEFLRTAEVASLKDVPVGITRPRQALLEKDGVRSRAIFRDLDQEREAAMVAGRRERNFRDSYLFECAAYELARMLGLDNVPPVVLRNVGGHEGSLQIWVENAMTEKDRAAKNLRSPNVIQWNKQMQTLFVFDNLVANSDRNQGNILIDQEWKLWMVDHTRAFLKRDDLLNPKQLYQCERGLWEKLKALNEREMEQRLKPYLRPLEIEALKRRHQNLVKYYEAEIAKRGESDVLYDN